MEKLKNKYKDYVLEESFVPNQLILRFENDYGFSIVSNKYSYGGTMGLYEIAYVFFDSKENNLLELVYVEEFRDSVFGYLTEDDVIEYVDKALSGKLKI